MPLTLIDALEDAARGAAGIDFVAARGKTGERLSYADFLRGSQRAAGGLVAAGVAERQPVLLVMGNGPELLTAFFGALLAGAIPAILPGPRAFADPGPWLEGLMATARHADAAPIVTTPALAKLVVGHRVIEVGTILSGPPLARPRAPRDTAVLQFTSGSLAAPKGVVLSHQAMLADALAIAERVAITPGDVGCFWVPLAHDMALVTFIMLMAAGVDQIVMPTERFAIDPAGWLELVAERATHTVGPPFAFGLALDRLRRKGASIDLSRLRGVVVGAEPIDHHILDRFLTELAPAGLRGPLFMPSYGLAELTCVGCLGAAGAPIIVEDGLVGHGPPLRGHAVRVVDGRIQLRGPALMDGYYKDEAATRAVMDDGWLVTGDLGFVRATEHGEMVFIAGREKDVIIVRGRHFFPEEIESLGSQVSGVRARGVCAFGVVDARGGGERVCVCVEVDGGASGVEREVKRVVADQLDLAVDVVVVPTGALPRTTSGKLRRAEARHLWGDA